MTYKRKEIIGDCTLYFGDCLAVMPTLGKVEHIISDPPYEKEAHKKDRRTQKSVKTGINVSLDFDMITEEIRDFITEWSVNNCNGWAMYFCQAEAVGNWRDSIEKFEGKYKRPMIWVKPDSTPQLNGQMPAIGYESIVLQSCFKGHCSWNGGGKRGVFTHLTNNKDREGTHPTEKPISLMIELVKLFTNQDNMVFDPFMGSGTTGVACVKLGRKFIGIELNEKYFDIACKRIEEAYRQPDMFIEPPKKIIQETLL